MQNKNMRDGFFDDQAPGWEERNYPPDVRAKLPEMIEAFALKPGQRILDVGCGGGVLFPYLKDKLGPGGCLIGLDTSLEMLKQAADKGQQQALLIMAKAESIPLIDEYVDAVVCFSAFPHVADKGAAAREFYRVLKPGGQLFIAHLGSREEINRHHDSHAAVKGDHLPCRVGMGKIFAAFRQPRLEEQPGWYLFRAVKE